MRKLILEGGNNPASIQARGLFSFVIQLVSVHRAYFLEKAEYKIMFDLRNSAYSPHEGNHWDNFFIQHHLDDGERTVWGDGGNVYGYSFDYGDLQERKIAKEIIDEHIKLQPHIQKGIDDFYHMKFLGKKTLGIHKRGTDISIHHEPASLESFFSKVDEIIVDYDQIFLSTDEKKVVDAFRERYPNVLNFSYQTLSDQPNLPNFKTNEGRAKGYQVGVDAIFDAYLLSKCSFLIKGNSNLSNFSLLNNPKLQFICI